MWPGSHADLKEHDQKFNQGNLLTRGQTIKNVPEDQVKPIELKAGQMSLHHPRIIHGSGINKSGDKRIGFVVQSYIGTNVKQVLGKNSVQIARGVDEFKYHEVINRTKLLMSDEGMLLRKREIFTTLSIFKLSPLVINDSFETVYSFPFGKIVINLPLLTLHGTIEPKEIKKLLAGSIETSKNLSLTKYQFL